MAKKKDFVARNHKDCLPNLPLRPGKTKKKMKVFLSRQFYASLTYSILVKYWTWLMWQLNTFDHNLTRLRVCQLGFGGYEPWLPSALLRTMGTSRKNTVFEVKGLSFSRESKKWWPTTINVAKVVPQKAPSNARHVLSLLKESDEILSSQKKNKSIHQIQRNDFISWQE